MTRSAAACFFYFFLRVIAALDKCFDDLISAFQEKRFCQVHEGEVQLALRPSGIGEVGVDDEYFHWFDRSMRGKPAPGAANVPKRWPVRTSGLGARHAIRRA